MKCVAFGALELLEMRARNPTHFINYLAAALANFCGLSRGFLGGYGDGGGDQRKGTNFNCRLHDNDNTPPHALFGGRSSQQSEIKKPGRKKKRKKSKPKRRRNVRIFDNCKTKSRHVQHGFVHDCRPA